MATVNDPNQPYPRVAIPQPQPLPPAGGIPSGQPVAPAATVPVQHTVAAPAPQAVVTQPVVMQPAPAPAAAAATEPVGEYPAGPVRNEGGEPTLRIYSHSNLLYWWPVWAVGFLMALLSYTTGQQYRVGDALEYYAHSSDLGLIWFVTLFLVILITNVPVRGLSSAMVILAIAFVTVLLAYLRLWDTILAWLGHLSIHLNLGAYMFISTLLFAVWGLSVFLFDRMNYYEITPGQVTRVKVFGAGQTSYEPENMVLEKYRNDFFRHWMLGLGSGDLKIVTGGTNRQELSIPNVLFAGQKVVALQRMIAARPKNIP
jgi:hypothetical protein